MYLFSNAPSRGRYCYTLMMIFFGLRLTGIVFLSLLFLPGVASAATYYVDATLGNNSNNGTATTTAWQTLAKVNAVTFTAGDTILFKRGETFVGNIVVGQSGTSGNPITFGAYGNGARPIINATTTNHGIDIRTNKSYLSILGLEIRNATLNQILLSSGVSNVTISDMVLYGGASSGVNLSSGAFSDITISSTTISAYTGTASGVRFTSGTTYTNILINTVTATSSTGTSGVSGNSGSTYTNLQILNSTFSNHTSHGINLSSSTSTDVLIKDTVVANNGGNGIFVTGGTRTNTTIDNVESRSNALKGINLIASTGNAYTGVSILNSNISANTGDGIAFTITGAGTNMIDLIISTTTSTNNGDHGILFFGNGSNLDLSNITATDNGTDGAVISAGSGQVLNDVTISSSRFQGNDSNGLAFTTSGTASDALVQDTNASDNANDGFNIHGAWMNIVFDRTAAESNGIDGLNSDGDGYSYHETSTGIIKNSLAHDNAKSAVTNINSTATILYNNIFSHDSAGTNSLVEFSGDGSHQVYNNVFYNPSNLGTALSSASTTALTARNNIISGFNVGIDRRDSSVLTEDYNLVFNTASSTWSGLAQGGHSLSADPKFVDAAGEDFRLKGSSPAINAGTSTPYLTDYAGNSQYGPARDMGAYEYQTEPDPEPVTEEEGPSRSRSGQSAIRVISPLADSVVNTDGTSPSTSLILANRDLFLWARAQGIVLPAFVLKVLNLSSGESAFSFTFTRSLTLGSSGADVAALQQILTSRGFYTYPVITGYYGKVTAQAVADFQKSLGLEGVGYVGPATRAALNSNN